MAKNKWRAREFKPTSNMQGRSHSFYGEAVIDSEIDNRDLAAKIAARTGFKSYEVQAVVAAVADIVMEEVMESNRITLSNEQGTKMVTIYPKVSGSVSDEQIKQETTAAHAQDPSVPIRTVAVESDLTPDRLTWTLGATIGIKFSKQFAMNKQAQKVKYVATDTAIPGDDEGGGDTPTPTPPSGGGDDDEGGDEN
jgi:hypothetical protein